MLTPLQIFFTDYLHLKLMKRILFINDTAFALIYQEPHAKSINEIIAMF